MKSGLQKVDVINTQFQDALQPIEDQTQLTQYPSLRQEHTNMPPCHLRTKLHKKSFSDDLTLLEKISLSKLQKKHRIIGPLDFHDRFNLTMPASESILQHQLEDLKLFQINQSIKLNSKKTKCLPFVHKKTKDFLP